VSKTKILCEPNLTRLRPPARFALTRLPSTITALPLSEALFALLASVWERNYAGVYSNAEKVLKASQAADNNLGVAVSPLVKAFLGGLFVLVIVSTMTEPNQRHSDNVP
jgi:hypothetical protein